MTAKNLLAVLVIFGSLSSVGETNVPCKPPKEVVEAYLNAGEQGKLLTAEGWNKASEAFIHSEAFPTKSGFFIVSGNHKVNETLVKGNRAQEAELGYQDMGRVDHNLRYFPPEKTPYFETGILYQLVLTDQYAQLSTDERKITPALCWKIENPQGHPWVSLKVAIQYLTNIRGETTDAAIKKNADETLVKLNRMQ